MLDELKQRTLGNSEKEEKLEVKKKAIDLLPDADDNLAQLQVGRRPGPARWWRACRMAGERLLFLFVAAAGGGGQCEEGGASGRPVGEAPSSAHPRTPHPEGGVQQPPRESSTQTCVLVATETPSASLHLSNFSWNLPGSSRKSRVCMKKSEFPQKKPRKRRTCTKSW